MEIFFVNTAIFIISFAGWFFSGLGFSFFLLPRNRPGDAFLLAPLIGFCLLIIIGLFQITVLLVPLYPRTNMAILIIVSMLLCVWCRKNILNNKNNLWKNIKYLSVIPLILLLTFSWVFHKDGIELLVASSDQLQYSQNARQIAEDMHTGSPQDIPVPRQQYFVYEMNTRFLPYFKMYRRGAEVILATTASVGSLQYEEAFPITVLTSLLMLGFVLGYIGRTVLRFNFSNCMILQAAFLSSFYLFLTHLQGSLALVLSISPLLMGLLLIVKVLRSTALQWWVLAFIVLAGYISLYAEQALGSMIFPSILLMIWEAWRSKKFHSLKGILRIVLLYLCIFCFLPFSAYSVFTDSSNNINIILTNLKTLITHTNIAPVHFFIPQWDLVGLVFGSYSYYDFSMFNYNITQIIQKYNWMEPLLFYFIGILSLVGFYRIKHRLTFLFSTVLFMWLLASTIFLYQQDVLRFMRSLQYEMPFIIIGLVILACHIQKKNHSIIKCITWIGGLTLISFVGLNIYTDMRTVHYITSHNVSNDSIILHFNEQANAWRKLHDELQLSAEHNIPVLMSGFKETIRPLAISVIIRSQPHMLGNSISQFWQIYNNFLLHPDVRSLCFGQRVIKIDDPISLPIQPKWQIWLNEVCREPYEITQKVLANRVEEEYPKIKVSMLQVNIISISPLADFFARLNEKKKDDDKIRNGLPKKYFNTRLSDQQIEQFQNKEYQIWAALEPKLLEKTEQAVVPVGNGYPVEWQSGKDIYSPLIKTFDNICDVVYRNQYMVNLPKQMISVLHADSTEPFRILLKSGPIIIHEKLKRNHMLEIDYEGKIDDVRLKIGKQFYKGQKMKGHQKLVKMIATITPEDDTTQVMIEVNHSVKLKSVLLYPSKEG